MMFTRVIIVGLLVAAGLVSAMAAGTFSKIKSDLSSSSCIELHFLSIVESDIFDSIDSTYGKAYLARDGRFRVKLGTDEYLDDGHQLYSYSQENNQVTIEQSGGGGEAGELSLLRKMDDWYTTYPTDSNTVFRLIRKSEVEGDIPDSMTVLIDMTEIKLVEISYLDINEELNRIILLHQILSDQCYEKRFEFSLPDSVERVKL